MMPNNSRGNVQNHRQNSYDNSNSFPRRGGGYDNGRGEYNSGRGGYDGSRGYNGYSRFGQQLDLKVSNLQSNATLTELREFFSGYGHLDKITMDTSGLGTVFTGTVYLVYKPRPKTDFWKHNIRFHGKKLRIEITSRPGTNFSSESRNQDFLLAESLEMGVFLELNTFVKEWKTDNDVKFKLNYARRSFEVEFGFTRGNGGKTYRFRLETYFNDVEGEFHTELDTQNERAVTTIRTKYPPKLSFLDKNLKTNNQFTWNLMECWTRKTALRVEKLSDEEMQQPTMPSYPKATGEELGRWYAYRITFIQDSGVDNLKRVLLKAAGYNLVPKEAMFSGHITMIDGSNLKKYVDRSMLDFDVLYMLECNITHGYLHDYNLNNEFMDLLARQKKETALSILHKFHQRKLRIYDPLSHLKLEVAKLQGGDNRQETVPSYCVMMRKVVITPSKMYILPPTIETSNRTIRYFKDHKERFLRVQFNDENGRLPSANGDNHVAAYNRVHRTLMNGIQIGNRKYEFLAFSSSQLRDHARITKRAYDADVRGLMNQYGVMTEYEVVSGFIINAIVKADHKKVREIQRAVSEAMVGIRRNYRQKFEKDIFAEYSVKSAAEAKNQAYIKSNLEAKACAWYYVTYHQSERGDYRNDNMISFPWTVDDHLCDIAIRNAAGRVESSNSVYRGSTTNTSYQRPSSARPNGSYSSQIERIVNVNLPAGDGGISRIRQSLQRNGL
ncbi:7867_t:CDS:2 [Paraglomus brasilianum]|uniref:7867_t:CDS:1 n=1 Tax=Paraglomus brasilianum TaxID=144538 RepID=A0A9N8WGH0_9GLOM|nr:7867_t:CDS:2 [Paraglomus brasilianum]